MPNSTKPDRTKEVVFVGSGGELSLRMHDNSVDSLCKAAETMKARFFVVIDEWNFAQNMPVWAVFDMRKAEKNVIGSSSWVLPIASKTFTAETSDAAVMWAVAKLGAG